MGVSSVKELERQTANLKRRLEAAQAEVARLEADTEVRDLRALADAARERAEAAEAKLAEATS